jgi:hypothetical protein
VARGVPHLGNERRILTGKHEKMKYMKKAFLK